MSSAGHIMDSINRMKANRALRNKRSSFNVMDANTFSEKPMSAYTKYRFKKATPEYLQKLRSQLLADRKNELLKGIFLLIIILLLIGFLLF